MTCVWNSVRHGLELPFSAMTRLWRLSRRKRIPKLDPRMLNAHCRRDLGFDN